MSTPSPPIIIDSGATGHFFKILSNLLGLKPTPNSIAVSLPDGSLIRSTHTGTLPVPGLPLSACCAHVFPSLQSHSLLSIGQLCDHGCKVVFTHNDVTITRDDLVLLTGTRSSATNGLWTLDPLDPATTQPRRHPVPSPDQSMPCFAPPWRTTPLPIELPFTMPACYLLPYPHGIMPSMPDTSQHGPASHPTLYASTLLNPFPCIKDISTKYELTFGRLAFPHPAYNN
jgi:hypothetical protein